MIERHSKVFVPVSVGDAAKLEAGKLLKVFKEYEQGGSTLYGFAEEKENVYVLTEQEFDFMQSYLSRLQAMLESGETYSFDNEYDFKDSKEIKDFFQSKTNPQTENK